MDDAFGNNNKALEHMSLCDGPNALPLMKAVVTDRHRGSKMIVLNHKHVESYGGGGSVKNIGE